MQANYFHPFAFGMTISPLFLTEKFPRVKSRGFFSKKFDF